MIGQTLSRFDITAKLGEGGMGEVYRAADVELGREVAIKVLPKDFVADAERLARFEREARVLASLDHPNIATLFEVGRQGDIHFLVMQLAEGEDLADRIARGPLPVDDAIAIARQIAAALEAAHDRGVVHRDLKPANVNVDAKGRVKVLDFGLARALEAEAGAVDSPVVTHSPTAAVGATHAGALLGTAAYMSPEQAKGRPADQRADLWALGAILWEMLTGQRLIAGDTVPEILAELLKGEIDWSALPPATPRGVRRLLRHCLERDPDRRLHHPADARLELDDVAAAADDPEQVTTPPRRHAVAVVFAALAGSALGVAGSWLLRDRSPPLPAPIVRFAIDPELPASGDGIVQPSRGRALALSRDGTTVVYAADDGAAVRLYRRRLDESASVPIDGTEHVAAEGVFLSPVGGSVAFYVGGRLFRAPLAGGERSELCDRPGATVWHDDGFIYGVDGSEVWRVVETGGRAETVVSTRLPRTDFSLSQLLPGGEHALVSAYGRRATAAGPSVEVGTLDLGSGDFVPLADGASPLLSARGQLVFSGRDTLQAAPFDVDRRTLAAAPVVVARGVLASRVQAIHFDLSATGTLVYLPSSSAGVQLVWASLGGSTTAVTEREMDFDDPTLSPDGSRLAVVARGDDPRIHIYDIERGVWQQLTVDGSGDHPVWSSDGEAVYFRSTRDGAPAIYRRRADLSEGAVKVFAREGFDFFPASASADGDRLYLTVVGDEPQEDIWVLSLQDGTATPVIATPSRESGSQLDPSGRWLAYVSDEAGMQQVRVAEIRADGKVGSRWTLSDGEGYEPRWSHDGTELYYRTGNRWKVVAVQTKPSFVPAAPRELFVLDARGRGGSPDYDVTADGRFLLIKGGGYYDPREQRIRVVLGWTEELASAAAPPSR